MDYQTTNQFKFWTRPPDRALRLLPNFWLIKMLSFQLGWYVSKWPSNRPSTMGPSTDHNELKPLRISLFRGVFFGTSPFPKSIVFTKARLIPSSSFLERRPSGHMNQRNITALPFRNRSRKSCNNCWWLWTPRFRTGKWYVVSTCP